MNNTIEVLEEIKKYYAQDIIRGTETGSKRFKAIDKAIADEKALESASDVLPEKIAPAVMTDKAWSHAEGFNEAILIAEPILAKQILKVKELEAKIKDI